LYMVASPVFPPDPNVLKVFSARACGNGTGVAIGDEVAVTTVVGTAVGTGAAGA